MATYQCVLTEVSDGVGTITLNRPERLNAFDAGMAAEMVAAARELTENPAVRVVVVTGNGRAFCAGADLGYLGPAVHEHRYDDAMEVVLRGGDLVWVLHEAPQPVLASVNGAAAGGGANLALACDLRIASDRASLGQVFHRIGLHPDMGGTYFLPRLVGLSRALELIWSAEMLTADHCLELGLVNRVVHHERLAEETAAWAARLAALPPLAAQQVKQAVFRSARSGLTAALERESQIQDRCFRSEDAARGIAAFTNKSVPVFHGR